ncbi:MAG: hypothetical protein H6679_02140 [Epsilonproteobacteria bacterium]|nr:hypothetical protein [Campylobacterota bacterium]
MPVQLTLQALGTLFPYIQASDGWYNFDLMRVPVRLTKQQQERLLATGRVKDMYAGCDGLSRICFYERC